MSFIDSLFWWLGAGVSGCFVLFVGWIFGEMLWAALVLIDQLRFCKAVNRVHAPEIKIGKWRYLKVG